MVALVHTIELRCIMVVPADERTKVTLGKKKRRFAGANSLKKNIFIKKLLNPHLLRCRYSGFLPCLRRTPNEPAKTR
jgi:hypothetical protein